MCLAIPGKIISIDSNADPVFREGKVSFGSVQRPVNLSMVPDARVDDYVLVHVGTAISVIDESEALTTLDFLRQTGDLEELEGEDQAFPNS